MKSILKTCRFLFLCLIFSSLFLSAYSNNLNDINKDNVFWYAQPAKEWVEALPMGNGRLGVMIFGGADIARIQLNDDSLWPKGAGWESKGGTKKDMDDVRELLLKGENKKADSLIVEKFANLKIKKSHQTLGDLFIDFDHKNISDYRRELNLGNAMAKVQYKVDGKQFIQKVFVSHPHRVIMIECSIEGEDGLNGKIRLSRPEDNGFPTAKTRAASNNMLVMEGEVTQREAVYRDEIKPILDGVKFETCLLVKNEGGEIVMGDDYLELKKVNKATFYIVSNSDFYHDDYKKQNITDLEAVKNLDFEFLQEKHIADHQSLFSRVNLKLTDEQLDSLPTDKRLERIKAGEVDLGLETLLFNYGRYLLIGCSRQGCNPANLQGLWNEHIRAPWNADYHLNINLQMNYWLANVTNMNELNGPLYDLIDKLVESGKTEAQKSYGCRGTVMAHATDQWLTAWMRSSQAKWGASFGAGGWIMQHYWQHFEFTRDTSFLKERAFPAMHEVVQFYSDWIMVDPRDGKLVAAPSTSPENTFINEKGEGASTCMGSAMDQQIIFEVFTNYIKTCEILEINNPLLDTIKTQIKQLRDGFVIGSDGRILEWDREYEESSKGHRHISHLYGFHPGSQVSSDLNPEVFKAVRKTLDYRLANGGAGTGWSRAWLINFSARLLDGDMAHEHILMLFKNSMYNNLFDAHPPFQIDGNFGYTAGVAEMLLQSHEENILRLLPALPTDWKSGHIKGLKARGGLTVDIYWSNNTLEKAVIKSDFNNSFNIAYGNKKYPVEIKKGESYVFKL